MRKWSKIFSKFALLYLVAIFFFLWGIATVSSEIFPWKYIAPFYKEIDTFFNYDDGTSKKAKDKVVLDHQERRSRFDFAGFQLRDQNFHDPGHLLISRYSKKQGQVIIELFSIADRKVVHTWVPPLSDILSKAPNFNTGINTKSAYRAQHPLLLKDGGLIFTSGEGPMVRMDACGDLVWLINRNFHHSIELDHAGNIVVPVKLEKKIKVAGNEKRGKVKMRDDGFAIVSLEGKVLAEYSITDILTNNGYRGLIYGVGKFEKDRIHLNDAQPILREIGEAKIGDIACSSRHLSTVFLFRPQSGKIEWLKTGPWLGQHDVNQLDDGRYSIFSNNIIRVNIKKRDKKAKILFLERRISNVYIFDPINDIVSEPYSRMITKRKIATPTQGRSKILANGDVYIEESDRSRLIRISKDTVRWEYVNSTSSTTVGALHWSRYIANNELDIKWKDKLKCN